MLSKWLAELILISHFLFILFALFGGLLVIKYRKIIWIHIPLMFWASIVNLQPLLCPLTYLENYFLRLAGEQGYQQGFISHYLQSIIYPANLPHNLAIYLGFVVLIVNTVIYSLVYQKNKKHPSK